jgi:hypothetical protein
MGIPRGSLSLDGAWSFIPDPERSHGPADLPPGDPITVPGCWEAQVAAPYGIVTAWYRRRFELPDGWDGGRLVIRFGAVMYACEVYLNGRRIGEHEGGYTPFEVEAGPDVVSGRPNELAVRVTNPLNVIEEYPIFPEADLRPLEARAPEIPFGEIPHGKQTWYSSQSGIWRSVTLERRPAVALRAPRIRPDVAAGAAIVVWGLEPSGIAALHFSARIELTVTDPDGRPAGSANVTIDPGEVEGTCAVPISDVRLWGIDRPNLYAVKARLVDGSGETLDEVSARFGMREIRTEGGRILLNGEPIYLLGVLDQDLYPDTISGPPSRAFLDEQMRLVREMGINVVRCHIKVPDPAYLDVADEAGVLVWCELPNWLRFTRAAAERGRRTLETMVEELGNHPSIVIWTIINEDWGTRLRREGRDRRWLARTYEWLKALDPTRLIVDNSACETETWPNFHVEGDLADFHVYFAAPDHANRWHQRIAEYAKRPAWLWSPHGDARERGDEPLVLSEFGSWGLPRPERLHGAAGGDPWWFKTGRSYFRPHGWTERFSELGLDGVWPSHADMADGTQWHQFEAMQFQIGELRRHDTIQGYVITELCDANWEANGLLDERRGTKIYHDRLADLNAPDVVIAHLDRRDLRGGEAILADVTLSSYGEPASGGTLSWSVEVGGLPGETKTAPIDAWPRGGARTIGHIEVSVPRVTSTSDAVLRVVATDGAGQARARNEYRMAVLPRPAATATPLDIAVHDPSGLWEVGEAIARLGYRVVGPPDADLVVTTELGRDLFDQVERGAHALVLVRSREAIAPGLDLARRVNIHPRQIPHSDWPDDRSPWDGDWVTTWSWLRHDILPGLPDRNPLDFAYAEVMPDHVLTGYDPRHHGNEVPAGMFAGWVHAPAALVWRFPQGRGSLTITTFRVAPESGPVANVLLDRLVRYAMEPHSPETAPQPAEGVRA